jgi:lipopolysaccharide transport system ATP-binding protein
MIEQPILDVKNVTLEYRSRAGLFKTFKHTALNDVTFSVHKGEVFGVLGKNGCGKSSLLQILAGIIEPDKGKVEVQKNVTRSLLSLGLGFNPQLSGRDNAILSCMISDYSKKQIKEKLDDIEEYAQLGKFFEQPVRTYSSGMKSRLGFATGVIVNVDILLIDETLSVGDSDFRHKAQETLLNKMAGNQTVIFVSHSERQIKKLCNRCIWLDKGVTRAYGLTEDVVKEYGANAD